MWWKITTVILLFYTVIAGFLIPIPQLPILNQSIRNLYFHVPMWFGMVILLGVAVVNSIKFLQTNNLNYDTKALAFTNVGLLLGVLGLITGSIWARFTWGAFWTNDPKLNGAAIGMLTYLAYTILRGSLDNEIKKARISAVYNIFAYSIFIPLIFILPRLTDSLHPGNGGNPGFGNYDLDNKMRLVFYPAVIGWTLLGWWIANINIRTKNLQEKIEEVEFSN